VCGLICSKCSELYRGTEGATALAVRSGPTVCSRLRIPSPTSSPTPLKPPRPTTFFCYPTLRPDLKTGKEAYENSAPLYGTWTPGGSP